MDLYGQSELRNAETPLRCVDELAKHLIEINPNVNLSRHGGPFVIAKPKERHKVIFDLVTDICEKLGFLLLAADEIDEIRSKFEHIDGSRWYYLECGRVKYHLYDCIFSSKAVSDSVSMLLNELFRLGYVRGEIDFIKERRFRYDLIQRNHKLHQLWENHAVWFKSLNRFRDALIHRQSFPVFIRYPETKVVFDLLYEGSETVDGITTDYYDIIGGPTGVLPRRNFKFRGSKFVASWKPDYVMPKDIDRFNNPTKKDYDLNDFQDAPGFCNFAFVRLRELSEIAFEVALNQITK